MTFKEKTEYENLMDIMTDDPLAPKEKNVLFEAEHINKPYPASSSYYKNLYVHFRNKEDLVEFANIIKVPMTINSRVIDYPYRRSALWSHVDNYWAEEKRKKRTAKEKRFDNSLFDHGADEPEWKRHWMDMPAFDNPANPPYHSITIRFLDEPNYQYFAERIGQKLTEKTKTIWHPNRGIDNIKGLIWHDTSGPTQPKYPLATISKGRADSMLTSKSLTKMRIHHYIIIEPQDEAPYEEALDKFGLREYATLIVAPFSNHGDGPGRARNYWWDYSKEVLGAEKHWVMDDNIVDFYRFQNNKRIRVDSGALFASCEDFMDRFSNVLMAGLQYRFFIAPDQAYPAYVKNTRIYSCNLIDNSCPWRWRGRYNEDTILSLDIMDNGYCTIQFNHFLQGKAATQTVGGGNTAEFYHAEGDQDKEKWDRGHSYNAMGTLNKSQMLVDAYPQYSTLMWRYDRWHHYVDYSHFKDIPLEYKNPCREIVIEGWDKPNEYNLELVVKDDM